MVPLIPFPTVILLLITIIKLTVIIPVLLPQSSIKMNSRNFTPSRVSNQPTNNHSLPRVVPLPIYDEGTVNPNIRRRKEKKKVPARDSFPSKVVEIVDDEISILPPQIETPDEDLTISAIPPQIEFPSLSPPIDPPVFRLRSNCQVLRLQSSSGDVGYKFLKFFPSHKKNSAKVVIIRVKLLQSKPFLLTVKIDVVVIQTGTKRTSTLMKLKN